MNFFPFIYFPYAVQFLDTKHDLITSDFLRSKNICSALNGPLFGSGTDLHVCHIAEVHWADSASPLGSGFTSEGNSVKDDKLSTVCPQYAGMHCGYSWNEWDVKP